MPKFKPKHIVVEARQYKATAKCMQEMARWRKNTFYEDEQFYVNCDDWGYYEMSKGDWVVQYIEKDGTELWDCMTDEDFRSNWSPV